MLTLLVWWLVFGLLFTAVLVYMEGELRAKDFWPALFAIMLGPFQLVLLVIITWEKMFKGDEILWQRKGRK